MKYLITLFLTLFSLGSLSKTVVIGNAKEWGEEGISSRALRRLYKGESFAFLVTDNKKLRESFYKEFLSQSYEENLKNWGILVFTGRASRPKVFDKDEEVVNFVRENPRSIGFINEENVGQGVSVILR